MRQLIMVLFLMSGLIFTPGGGMAQEQEKSAPHLRVAVAISASAGLQEDIREIVVGSLKNHQNFVVTEKDPDFTLEILGLSSADANIYCDSIITLSAVYLEGTDRFKGHFATTFPSEYLKREGRKIVEKLHLEYGRPER